MPERFLRVEKSITYVFLIGLNIPIPTADTIQTRRNWNDFSLRESAGDSGWFSKASILSAQLLTLADMQTTILNGVAARNYSPLAKDVSLVIVEVH